MVFVFDVEKKKSILRNVAQILVSIMSFFLEESSLKSVQQLSSMISGQTIFPSTDLYIEI